MVGKWHLGSTEAQHPMSRGFDEFFGFLHGGNLYLDPLEQPGVHFIERGPEGEVGASTAARSTRSCAAASRSKSRRYLTDAFTREAVSFIDRHQQRAVLPLRRVQRAAHAAPGHRQVLRPLSRR